ncbi:VOC family protein [Ornithinimicrobium sp. W1665]|uniref:VOC family protein n=1 Tax=Ornithinimicrobium sp. W1665 TaxID=3416666 RepID=UPI003CE93FC9
MPVQLDHLVLTVRDLDAAVSDFATRTGVEPVAGGSHPGMGTRNALVGVSWQGARRAYLELLGPDPDQPPVPPERTMLGAGDVWGQAPRLHGWAVEAPGTALDEAVERARQAGVDVGRPVATQRRRADGTLLSWRLAAPYPLGLGGVQPFLIDWQGGAHPSDADLPWLELKELRAEHPDPVLAVRVIRALGAQVDVAAGPAPRLIAVVGAPAGDLTLT